MLPQFLIYCRWQSTYHPVSSETLRRRYVVGKPGVKCQSRNMYTCMHVPRMRYNQHCMSRPYRVQLASQSAILVGIRLAGSDQLQASALRRLLRSR